MFVTNFVSTGEMVTKIYDVTKFDELKSTITHVQYVLDYVNCICTNIHIFDLRPRLYHAE